MARLTDFLKTVRTECFMSFANKTYRSMNSVKNYFWFTLRYNALRHHSGRTGFTLIFLVSLVCTFKPLEPVVIVVHGSFAQSKTWWRPGGDFFDQLMLSAVQKGHEVVPFGWSGNPSEKDITLAGELLAWLMLSYPAQEHIVLVGHSHGGNVVNYATQVAYKELEKRLHETSELQPQALMDLVATLRTTAISEKDKALALGRTWLIDKIYLLGTPVGVKDCYPRMEIVGSVLNLYSRGDYVQQVLGMYGRTFPQHGRLANLELTTGTTMQGRQQPGHFKLHSSAIGHWLLSIPESLAAAKSGNFENFEYGDGIINFDRDTGPVYIQNKTPSVQARGLAVSETKN